MIQTVRITDIQRGEKFMFFPNSQVYKVFGSDYINGKEIRDIKNTVTGKETTIGENCNLHEILVYPVKE